MRTVMVDGAEVMMPDVVSGREINQSIGCPQNKFLTVVRNSNGVPMKTPVQNSNHQYEMMDGDRIEAVNRVPNGIEG